MYLPSSLLLPSESGPTPAHAYQPTDGIPADAAPSTHSHAALISQLGGQQEMAATNDYLHNNAPCTNAVHVLDTTSTAAVHTRSMHITEPVVGEIVGAIALFVVVNVVLISLAYKRFCAQRTGSADAESRSFGHSPTRARGKRNLPVAGRIPLRRPKKHPPPIRVSTEAREDREDDAVKLCPTATKGDLQFGEAVPIPGLPVPTFRG